MSVLFNGSHRASKRRKTGRDRNKGGRGTGSSREDFLQQRAAERKERAVARQRNEAATAIQAAYRGHVERMGVAALMRARFDDALNAGDEEGLVEALAALPRFCFHRQPPQPLPVDDLVRLARVSLAVVARLGGSGSLWLESDNLGSPGRTRPFALLAPLVQLLVDQLCAGRDGNQDPAFVALAIETLHAAILGRRPAGTDRLLMDVAVEAGLYRALAANDLTDAGLALAIAPLAAAVGDDCTTPLAAFSAAPAATVAALDGFVKLALPIPNLVSRCRSSDAAADGLLDRS